MFGSRFLDNSSKDMKNVKVFERIIQVLPYLFGNPLDIFATWTQNVTQVDLPSSTHYASDYLCETPFRLRHVRSFVRSFDTKSLLKYIENRFT